MRRKKVGILAVVLLLAVGTAVAHEVQHALTRSEAWVVTLETDDGEPFADKPWEVRAEGSGATVAQGRTDAAGRLAFLPPAPGRYALRAESPDGHGVVLPLRLDAVDLPPAAAAEPTQLPGRRWGNWLSALGYLMGIFGVVALLIGRRR